MQTKIVYVLVSDSSDYYFEQMIMSLESLNKHQSHATVEIVVDTATSISITNRSTLLKRYAISVHTVSTPEIYTKKQRSRYLKTLLRQIIKGNFLFVDCDTVICGDLSKIDNLKCDLAAVADTNGALPLTDTDCIELCKSAGFNNLQGRPYFNSGVMYVRDSPLAHRFYEKWHTHWLQSLDKGILFDQPALCQTNFEMGEPISELSGIWNCQFKFSQGYSYLNKALIMHYFNGDKTKYWNYPTDSIFQYIRANGDIDDTIKKMLEKPSSWLYAVMTIDQKRSFHYFNSEMVDFYVNNPPLFRLLLKIAHRIDKPMKLMGKIKSAIRR